MFIIDDRSNPKGIEKQSKSVSTVPIDAVKTERDRHDRLQDVLVTCPFPVGEHKSRIKDSSGSLDHLLIADKMQTYDEVQMNTRCNILRQNCDRNIYLILKLLSSHRFIYSTWLWICIIDGSQSVSAADAVPPVG